jgi:hypothetical protein
MSHWIAAIYYLLLPHFFTKFKSERESLPHFNVLHFLNTVCACYGYVYTLQIDTLFNYNCV